jgi:Amt family ammonium transporter
MHNEAALFLVICSALVLFMTPGLAFFYGGLVRASSVVSMMMMSFGALGLVAVMWLTFGYAIAFSDPTAATFVGIPGVIGFDPAELFMNSAVAASKAGDQLPLAFGGFQGTFAIITVALISGAIADRAKFGSWMVFAALWATVVYFPVASWVFNFKAVDGKVVSGGWLVHNVGLLDFAGGTVVEIASGASALAVALVVGKRFGFTKGMHAPHNVPLVLIGVAILLFGWFGFNAGSELAADGTAALAFINTLAAPVGAMLSWALYEKFKHGKATSIGAGTGAVAGAVAITPSCAFLTPMWSLVLGVVVGIVCAIAIEGKYKLGFDDSLDVVGVHLVAGLIGTVAIGVIGNNVGLVYGADASQLGKQVLGSLVVGGYAFIASWLLVKLVDRIMGFRVTSSDEIAGIDLTQHGHAGYGGTDPRWDWTFTS